MMRFDLKPMVLALTLASPAFAQDILYQPVPDSPIGERNSQAPSESAQFDFVIGDWDVDITWYPVNGDPASYRARWHNHWIVDGYVVMQEWRGPYLTGAEFRYFDPVQKRWTGRNIYAGRSWADTTAEFIDGRMVVTIPNRSGPRGPFINRETYFDITPDGFRMKSEISLDNGTTWEMGAYEMTATRSKPNQTDTE